MRTSAKIHAPSAAGSPRQPAGTPRRGTSGRGTTTTSTATRQVRLVPLTCPARSRAGRGL